MKPETLTANWIDLVILGLLVVGMVRGRKRGLSEELLDVLKWTFIVLVASFAYEPTGLFLAQTTSLFSLLSCHVFAYSLLALFIALFFAYVRRRVGDKLVTSDAFGDGEYYLGMLAGMYRYLCVILVTMAFLNARYYTPAEARAEAKFQEDNFGSISFPTLCQMQQTVFDKSFSGRLAQEYLFPVLIKPTAPDDKAGGGGTFRRRPSVVNEILDKR